jgi:3-hydroxyisobutyrate dehydrogenase-like beta-hydroxyacid dehydrogenase
MPEVAVLGTGIMGAPMARNLARAGFHVKVWNRNAAKARALVPEGIVAAATAADAAGGVSHAVLMLTDASACEAVLFDQGVAAALKPGATVVIMSSIAVDAAIRIGERLAQSGLYAIDAPVSGGEKGAIDATLTIMAGGDATVITDGMPVLKAMGTVTHVGPLGSGQLAKLANQLIVGVTIGAVSEAMLLVERGGGNAAAVHRALMGGFADSTIWRQHGQRILDRNFVPGARASVQLKDMRTITGQAAGTGLELPFASLAEALFDSMCLVGRADLDHSGLYLQLAKE